MRRSMPRASDLLEKGIERGASSCTHVQYVFLSYVIVVPIRLVLRRSGPCYRVLCWTFEPKLYYFSVNRTVSRSHCVLDESSLELCFSNGL